MNYKIVLLFSFLLPQFAFSGAQVDEAKVVNVRVDKNGKGYIRFDKPLTGAPASCISGHAEHLAFDLSTPGGKGIMSVALAAQASGKTIKAQGNGQCDIYGTVESWSWGYVHN